MPFLSLSESVFGKGQAEEAEERELGLKKEVVQSCQELGLAPKPDFVRKVIEVSEVWIA